MRLAIWRVWVWIKAPHGHFSHWFVVKMVDVCLKMTEKTKKIYDLVCCVQHIQHCKAHAALYSTYGTVQHMQHCISRTVETLAKLFQFIDRRKICPRLIWWSSCHLEVKKFFFLPTSWSEFLQELTLEWLMMRLNYTYVRLVRQLRQALTFMIQSTDFLKCYGNTKTSFR